MSPLVRTAVGIAIALVAIMGFMLASADPEPRAEGDLQGVEITGGPSDGTDPRLIQKDLIRASAAARARKKVPAQTLGVQPRAKITDPPAAAPPAEEDAE